LLGDEAAESLSSTDQFPVTQDQRHTVRSRLSYQITPAAWVAFSANFGSGLPVEFSGDRDEAASQYGQRIVDRVDFEDRRVRPSYTLDGSVGYTIRKTPRHRLSAQADVRNLTNQLTVINFAGLFSGTALAPPRSIAVRLQTDF